jgi:hypothetical protein
LPDGRIVCGGAYHSPEEEEEEDEEVETTLQPVAQVLEPSAQETSPPSETASWQWRYLPDMSVAHYAGKGCVMSDGRFAVFGGMNSEGCIVTSCEVLTLDGDGERWEPLPPMHVARKFFACTAIGGCVVVAGGSGTITTEMHQEARGRWRRLPCSLPHHDVSACAMGSALMP